MNRLIKQMTGRFDFIRHFPLFSEEKDSLGALVSGVTSASFRPVSFPRHEITTLLASKWNLNGEKNEMKKCTLLLVIRLIWQFFGMEFLSMLTLCPQRSIAYHLITSLPFRLRNENTEMDQLRR